jgi:DNA adenine methylase
MNNLDITLSELSISTNKNKDKDKINNQSPLRYPGGKTRACKILDDVLQEYFDISKFTKIISPFFGGGSFEFYLQNKYNLKIMANDKFEPLYNFWNICKYDNINLCNELYKNIDNITKEIFTKFRKEILVDDDNKLNKAIMYFIINRCSFSGATLSGGFSEEASKKRFTKSSIDKIKNLNLNNFQITNIDCIDFINNNSDSLIFLDPPYYLEKQSKLYGNNGDMHESFDHKKLFESLSSTNNTNWFMTYNNCDYIKELYKDYKIIETNWTYGMNKSKKSSEIIIINNIHFS